MKLRVWDEKKDESNKLYSGHIVKNVLGTLKNEKNRLEREDNKKLKWYNVRLK